MRLARPHSIVRRLKSREGRALVTGLAMEVGTQPRSLTLASVRYLCTHTHARRHTLLFLLRMPTLPVKAWPSADHLLSKNMHTFPSFFATAKFVLI